MQSLKTTQSSAQTLLMVLSCRIGYPIPMFTGFCIMFLSTISKWLVSAWESGARDGL